MPLISFSPFINSTGDSVPLPLVSKALNCSVMVFNSCYVNRFCTKNPSMACLSLPPAVKFLRLSYAEPISNPFNSPFLAFWNHGWLKAYSALILACSSTVNILPMRSLLSSDSLPQMLGSGLYAPFKICLITSSWLPSTKGRFPRRRK